jgi:DNA-binding GntR family transcriptional regulator
MESKIDNELAAIEAAQAAMQSAVNSEDWDGAQAGNDRLNAGMSAFAQLVDSSRLSVSSLESVLRRLEPVLQAHNRLLASLVHSRHEAAAELGRARNGRRVAACYLDAAGRSA